MLALARLKGDPDQLGPSPCLSSTTKLRQGFHSNENSLKGRKGGEKGDGGGKEGHRRCNFYIDLHQAQWGAMKTCEKKKKQNKTLKACTTVPAAELFVWLFVCLHFSLMKTK